MKLRVIFRSDALGEGTCHNHRSRRHWHRIQLMCGLPEAQHTIRDTLPQGFCLLTRPGDGRCLFFQTILPGLSVEDFQQTDRWGDEDNLKRPLFPTESSGDVRAEQPGMWQPLEHSSGVSGRFLQHNEIISAPGCDTQRCLGLERNILLGESFDVHDMPQCKVGGSNHTSAEPVVHDPVRTDFETGHVELDGDTFLRSNFGKEQLESDVQKLLQCYVDGNDCRSFLKDPPLFQPCPDVGVLADEFHQAIGML